ncbi:M15 family metallopeptidase [Nonomuraea pusilla]|uniref:D-alanyl-D-alanine carboxypeptidase n=1 Tax=Nonomuraea pusilla TaxID=46177 RepID=A0A1H7Q3B6_9ACTN|nr:M15 family metallopeptidase [Nonomuraea pusilla]SEL42336.1 D-alanyl-D-alanine carboxypeptidase [Nonomuraea pusilla]
MKRAAAIAFVVLASVSCGATEPVASSAPTTPGSPAPSPAPSSVPPSTATTPASPRTPSPTRTGPPAFSAKVTKISRDRLPYSWRPGCPVPYQDLRLVTMTYWGFDDKPHTGELVVRDTVTDDVVTVFRKLYDWRWPIRQMKLVDAYKADDYASIDADNTSAFNCRRATGSSSWSKHSYGQAIDLNPLENPYVTADGGTAHKNAKKYASRPMSGKGVINAGDKVVKAFANVGWEWGGYWSGTKDYQHFSKGGG